MTKQEFISALRERRAGLPEADLEERLAFYGEMIDDRIEEGEAEEDAVSEIGTVEGIAEEILAEIPLRRIARERMRPRRRLAAWEIVLLAVGSPIWLSLAVAAFSVLLSLYAVLWSVIVSFWAVFATFAVTAPAGAAAGILLAVRGDALVGATMLAAGLVLAGLAIFAFFGCRAATRGASWLTRWITVSIKRCLIGGRKVE